MTNIEIRARLERCKAQMEVGEVVYRVDHNWALSSIEALLARQVEVMESLPPECCADMDAYEFGAASLGDRVRAILDPQEPRT